MLSTFCYENGFAQGNECVCVYVCRKYVAAKSGRRGAAGKCSFLPSCFLPLKKYQRYIAQNFSSPPLPLFFWQKGEAVRQLHNTRFPRKKTREKKERYQSHVPSSFLFLPHYAPTTVALSGLLRKKKKKRIFTLLVFVPGVLFVVVRHLHVLVVQLVLGLPSHLVLLLQAAAGVGEPGAHLGDKEEKLKSVTY